jgi:hypothetical protein
MRAILLRKIKEFIHWYRFRPRYIITRIVHPMLSATTGYLRLEYHHNMPWRWMKNRSKATSFKSKKLAEITARGCALNLYTSYKIEML